MQLQREQGIYEKYIKRLLDICCSLLTIIVFWWLYLIIAIIVRVKMGSPVIFKQARPGKINPKTGKECIFYMYKFRTMTDERDENGKLLSDEKRLNKFGKALRASSMDELPEVINILKGDMSIIGPRPQLVRDMVFMTEKQRIRHTARPGLSGLAQVMGRNAISWDEKFKWDLKYVEDISFKNDVKVIWYTVKKVFGKTESLDELDVTLDYGDSLLAEKNISQKEYDALQEQARELINKWKRGGCG